MSNTEANRNYRSRKGQAICEFGPALWLLFFFIFFPLIDVLNMSTTYFCGFILNDLQATAAAERTRPEAADSQGAVKKGIPEAWASCGIGQFTKLVSQPQTDISYTPLLPGSQNQCEIASGAKDQIVGVTTALDASPMINMPFIPGVPGLSAPYHIVYHAERVMERSSESSTQS